MLKNIKRMERYFYPVGQGAFYRERFSFEDGSNFNIVYDCGTTTPKGNDNIEKIIDEWGNEKLDILFISHFHEDHISKITSLINKLKVKLIIAPFLTAIDKEVIKIEILRRNSELDKKEINYENISNTFKIIDRYETYLAENAKEIKLVAKNELDNNSNYKNVSYIKEGEINIDEYGFPYSWIIDTYVIDNNKKNDIINIFYKHFGEIDKLTIRDVKDILENKNKKQILKELYGKKIHKMCLLVYSGPINDSIYQNNYKYCKIRNCLNYPITYCKNTKNAGCLYTGDFEANDSSYFKELCNHFYKYINKIGCLQVPHHGSKNNFNNSFLKLNCFYVICAGKHNKYKHPSKTVIQELKNGNKVYFIVNENSRIVKFIINF